MSESRREARLRRQADHHGLALRKSRVREPNLDNLGGYMLVDRRYNVVIYGERWQLDLDAVEAYVIWLDSDTEESYSDWLKRTYPEDDAQEGA